MIIKSLYGKILIKTPCKTVKSALEYAVDFDTDLSFADLRGAKLRNASLDGIRVPNACLWGADLTGADMGVADMRMCDLRCADLSDTCLAGSDLSGTDMRGAYFSSPMLEGANLSGIHLSCPSFWNNDLQFVKSLKGMIYSHRGEVDIRIESAPVVIHGLGKRLVVMGDKVLWGNELHQGIKIPADLEKSLFDMRIMMDRLSFRNATCPNPKIHIQKHAT